MQSTGIEGSKTAYYRWMGMQTCGEVILIVGAGDLCSALASDGKTVLNITGAATEDCIEIPLRLQKRIKIADEDFFEFDFGDHTFSDIIFNKVFEKTYDLVPWLEKAQKLLKPAGNIFVICDVRESMQHDDGLAYIYKALNAQRKMVVDVCAYADCFVFKANENGQIDYDAMMEKTYSSLAVCYQFITAFYDRAIEAAKADASVHKDEYLEILKLQLMRLSAENQLLQDKRALPKEDNMPVSASESGTAYNQLRRKYIDATIKYRELSQCMQLPKHASVFRRAARAYALYGFKGILKKIKEKLQRKYGDAKR